MPKVESTAITHADYGDRARCLFVTFVTGRVYVYDGVPRDVYAALLRAPSKGEFFNGEIRDRYRATRVRGARRLGH